MTKRRLESSEREVFVVRLWCRTSDGAAWAGVIQHVGTGAVTRVRNARELLAYLAVQFEEGELPGPQGPGLR
ncbi:hypothetical protein TFLX_03855 [Thermoflexales bacterium]|nr:hypothetical protein TFLX_03855 [Thermoflexales bacterium]